MSGRVKYMKHFQSAMNDIMDIADDDENSLVEGESITPYSIVLYHYIHQSYVSSINGVGSLRYYVQEKIYGTCPRYGCNSAPLIPFGQHAKFGLSKVSLLCPICGQYYRPPIESALSQMDGSAFGPSAAHVLLNVYVSLSRQFEGEDERIEKQDRAALMMQPWAESGRVIGIPNPPTTRFIPLYCGPEPIPFRNRNFINWSREGMMESVHKKRNHRRRDPGLPMRNIVEPGSSSRRIDPVIYPSPPGLHLFPIPNIDALPEMNLNQEFGSLTKEYEAFMEAIRQLTNPDPLFPPPSPPAIFSFPIICGAHRAAYYYTLQLNRWRSIEKRKSEGRTRWRREHTESIKRRLPRLRLITERQARESEERMSMWREDARVRLLLKHENTGSPTQNVNNQMILDSDLQTVFEQAESLRMASESRRELETRLYWRQKRDRRLMEEADITSKILAETLRRDRERRAFMDKIDALPNDERRARLQQRDEGEKKRKQLESVEFNALAKKIQKEESDEEQEYQNFINGIPSSQPPFPPSVRDAPLSYLLNRISPEELSRRGVEKFIPRRLRPHPFASITQGTSYFDTPGFQNGNPVWNEFHERLKQGIVTEFVGTSEANESDVARTKKRPDKPEVDRTRTEDTHNAKQKHEGRAKHFRHKKTTQDRDSPSTKTVPNEDLNKS
ncbi:putative casein kinase II subunit beta [Blattamonas nauphoetae]|uniref:Casein kinase II subunit beta n=1 Tax=Blattamonas nauphoetae TaxID=2049346 RepID=A0ABQ9XI01_9EUKA|nr:putative casein kinase II subunit beta [Blattamonas nauphoetae]